MVSRILVAFLLAVVSQARAATVKGTIILNQLGGPPVPNVDIIDSAHTGGPWRSKSDGGFTLDYPNRYPGERVHLVVHYKEGYLVVNDFQIAELFLPADPDANPLQVIICKESDRYEMACRFYQLKSFDAIEETYQRRKMTELQEAHQADAAAIAKLKQELDKAHADAESADYERRRSIEILEESYKMRLKELENTQQNKAAEVAKLKLELDNAHADAESADYERRRGFEVIEGTYKMRLKELENTQQNKAAEVAKLKLELDNAHADAASADDKRRRSEVETYKIRLKEIENRQQANAAAKLAKLQQERDQAKAAEASKELAKNQPGRSSELYQQAKSMFVEGKIDEAIKLLDDEELRQSLTQSKKAIEDVVQPRLLKAQLLTIQLRFEDAEKAYLQAIYAAPDNFTANFAFAYFSQGLNRYQQAVNAYKRCLELARRNQNNSEVATILNNLANLESDQNRMEEARRDYSEALNIRRKLAKKNPDIYLPEVADTLSNQGILDCEEHRMKEARRDYSEALKIRRELAKKNPDVYLPDLATTLHNLGILDRAQKRTGEARTELEQALQIRRDLARKNPDVYRPEVADTLNNLGNLESEQNRMEEARNDYSEALQIYRELAKKNPDVYLPKVATALNNLGILDRAQNLADEARTELEQALQTYRDLAQKNPGVYGPYVAAALNNLGNLDSEQKRTEEARREYTEALNIYESFAENNPERFSADVTRVRKLLAKLPK